MVECGVCSGQWEVSVEHEVQYVRVYLAERDGRGGHVEEEGLSVLGRRGHRQRVRAQQRLHTRTHTPHARVDCTCTCTRYESSNTIAATGELSARSARVILNLLMRWPGLGRGARGCGWRLEWRLRSALHFNCFVLVALQLHYTTLLFS